MFNKYVYEILKTSIVWYPIIGLVFATGVMIRMILDDPLWFIRHINQQRERHMWFAMILMSACLWPYFLGRLIWSSVQKLL